MKVGGTYTINGKEGWFCTVCDSHLGINIVGDDWVLMRSGEVHIDECWLCKEAYEGLLSSGLLLNHILDTFIEVDEGGVE